MSFWGNTMRELDEAAHWIMRCVLLAIAAAVLLVACPRKERGTPSEPSKVTR